MSEYLEDLNATIVFQDMPCSIKAFVRRMDGLNCIVVNSNLNRIAQYTAIWHEIKHIIEGDIDKSLDVLLIEAQK